MTDAILGAVLENLTSLIRREFGLIWGIEEDMTNLVQTLSTVRDVLEEAEIKQFTEKPIANWLRKLKDVAYDADDVLHEWLTESEQPELDFTNRSFTNHVSHFISSHLNFKQVRFRRRIAKRMKKITSAFDEIAAQKNKFLLNPVVGLQTRPQYVVRESSSILTEPQIYGRDGDKQNITDMLLSNNLGNQDDLSVCPIIGIGGIGKTTLAQLVYNDERIVRWFEVRIWICVSEPFDVKKVLKAIIESYDKKDCSLENLESIQIRVGEILRNKRCLLVLDDVWNENRDEWNILKSSLNGGAKGSSIIVTTRLETVASITGTLPNYILKPLSDDQCWSLFKSRAFGDRDEEPPNLVKIGKEIVERCRGVPLAAKSLGSMLWSKSEDSQWKLVRDSEIWKLTEDAKSGILPVLRFSYNYLPPHLRQCFAYCSIFPKDHKMGKDELIYLWIANGFIKSIGGVEPEDVGNEIFNLLLWRSFFQDVVKDESGNVVNCTMHDLMHDLASSVMENDSPSPKVDKETKVITNVRHFALNFDSQTSPIILQAQKLLRTLFFFRKIPVDPSLFNFSSLTCLRVLHLKDMDIEILPPSICVLKHLSYLNLSCNLLTFLPESIYRLTNLQTLDLSSNTDITLSNSICKLQSLRYINLSSCYNLFWLPESIGNLESLRRINLSSCFFLASLPESLSNLRNLQSLMLSECGSLWALPKSLRNMNSLRQLDMIRCHNLSKMPVGIGQLTCLQTLNIFVVGKPNVDGESGGIKELQELNQLRGGLEIRKLENVRNAEEAQEANLRSKKYLTKLSLSWSAAARDSLQPSNNKEVLEGLQPPPTIQELKICGYQGETHFPLGFLQNLSSLQSLTISDCDKLLTFPEEIQHLSMLQSLEIERCNNLRTLPECLQHLTTLQSLNIRYCHPDLDRWWPQRVPQPHDLPTSQRWISGAIDMDGDDLF